MDARDRTIYYTNMYLKKKKIVEATTVQIREIWGGKSLLRLNSSRAVCPTKWSLFGEKAVHLSYQIMAAIGMKCLFSLMHFKIFFPF